MKDFFEKYQIKDEVIAVGVSGGADSLALVLRIKEAGKKPIALTVDHGLRSESGKEAEFVAEVMRTNGIEHHILVWEGNKPEVGVEEAARQARYGLMFEFCHKRGISVLATGHHMRDQAETFLLRLQRGSGVFGLSGILPVSERDGVVIIRPQLAVSPEYLREYLQKKGINWIEDPMNQDEDFARVKIRKFLPKLAEIGLDEKKIALTAQTISNTRAFLQKEVDKFVSNNVRWWDGIVVSLSWIKLKELDIEVAMPVLGQLLQKIGKSIYIPEADDILRILMTKGNFKGCTLGNCELFIAAKRLWIVPQDKDNRLMSKKDWDAFVEKFVCYKNAGLPYKVRRALWLIMEGKNG